MTAVLLPWLKFAVCVVLIGLGGPVLTRYADVIARLAGLSRSWIGLILLATATSLPELFTGVSAVVAAKAPDIAFGGALGSCVINLVMLAAVVVAAGSWLPFVGNELAEVMGWQATFVGTLLVAGATSVPELVVTLSAFRLGAVDMAIGNILGSNLFDMLVLSIDDIAYLEGSLLRAVSPAHAITAFAAVIMSGIFIVAMLYKPETRVRGTIGWVSLGLLVVYLFSAYAIYLEG